MTIIRLETLSDRLAVNLVNEAAFGRQNEAALVDVLRNQSTNYISLVAELDGRIVGHIFFSVVSIDAGPDTLTALGLAPMAVLPLYQNQGIGSQLVTYGLDECLRQGHTRVVVVGHPNFYPRFGFVQAAQRNLTCEFDVPKEVFMVAELKPGALDGIYGLVRYHPAFQEV